MVEWHDQENRGKCYMLMLSEEVFLVGIRHVDLNVAPAGAWIVNIGVAPYFVGQGADRITEDEIIVETSETDLIKAKKRAIEELKKLLQGAINSLAN